MKLLPDSKWFRSTNGLHLLAGSPLTSFTVTEAGAHILNAIENGDPLPKGHEALTSRLLATGAAHPTAPQPANHSTITVVIPAFIRAGSEHETLQNLVKSLKGLHIVVVNDCSSQEFTLPGVHVIRNLENEGPGNSRNTGLEEVTTEFVAFVDVDTIVTARQLQELAGYLSDESLSIVAPRVASINNKTFISEYESVHSPLDLGVKPAVVRPLSRVSYVPSAVLVARTSSMRQLGSFDDAMRVGEDVDLVWRATSSGHVVRYIPSVVCEHTPRPTVRALLKQRFSYGTSAASLDRRHRLAASPLRANVVMLLPAVSLLYGNIFSFLILAPLAAAYFLSTLNTTRLSVGDRMRVIFFGFQSTLSLTASAISRAWWPIFFLASYFSIYAAAMLIFSVLVPPVFGIMRKKTSYPLQYIVIRPLENVAYGFGVWVGAIRARNFRCLLPVFTFRRTQP